MLVVWSDCTFVIAFQGAAAVAAGSGSPPPPEGRRVVCRWVGYMVVRSRRGIGNIVLGAGAGMQPLAPGLGFCYDNEASGGVGALGAFGAVSSFVREVA